MLPFVKEAACSVQIGKETAILLGAHKIERHDHKIVPKVTGIVLAAILALSGIPIVYEARIHCATRWKYAAVMGLDIGLDRVPQARYGIHILVHRHRKG